MAKVKEEENNESVEVKKLTSTGSKNTKPKTTIQLRDPNGKINLMTVKKKRMAKTIEEWFKPSNYRLLTEASKHTLENGKTALQIAKELDK